MRQHRLDKQARTALTLTGFYWAAESLCSIFVSVYLLRTGQDFGVVFRFYTAVYAVTPIFFLLAGWYAQARDRLHMYRMGLALHAMYYGTLLVLRKQAPDYAVVLGVLLGVTWGCFWAGANTIAFDVTSKGNREYYFGTSAAVTGAFQLVAPVVGGFIIHQANGSLAGYYRIFAAVVVLYLCSFGLTFLLPPDGERRPYRIKRALFPGKDQRDWRLVMLASASLVGSYSIFQFLLGLLMYDQTKSELSVGGYASFQAVVGIVMSYMLGRTIVPRTWKRSLFWGTVVLVAGGMVVCWEITTLTLIVFGFTRTASGTLINIPHSSLRFEVISKSAEDPAQRIEYISAWEVPLALGRLLVMGLMMWLYATLGGLGLQISLLLLCLARVLTFYILLQTTALQQATVSGKSELLQGAAKPAAEA